MNQTPMIKYQQYHNPHQNTCKFYADRNENDARPQNKGTRSQKTNADWLTRSSCAETSKQLWPMAESKQLQ